MYKTNSSTAIVHKKVFFYLGNDEICVLKVHRLKINLQSDSARTQVWPTRRFFFLGFRG